MKTFGKVLNYLLTAAVASLVTALLILNIRDGGYNKLAELEMLIDALHVDGFNQKLAEDEAARAMVASLDRWSYYVSAEKYDALYNSRENNYVGIGISVQKDSENRGMKILEVTSGGPSEKAGLQVGDVILEVDGVSLAGKTASEAKTLIQGEKNTRISMKILRDGAEQSISVTREVLKLTVATGVLLDGGVGLVTIENFNTNCFADSKRAVEQLLAAGAEKLIFDVRNNVGGYTDEMISLLDYLLPEGQLTKMVEYDGSVSLRMSDAACVDVPMAVLINGSSYSAAEFFAAALREFDAAVLVGEKTTGKGYYQRLYRLKDGSAVNLSVGKYYTPNNVNLEGIGLTPDHEVPVDELTAAKINAGVLAPEEDPQIQKALSVLRKNG